MGGVDVSSFLSSRFGVPVIICLVGFFLVYPIVVSVFVIKVLK